MTDDIPFVPFPKLYRLNRQITVTEKIDGTNACVVISPDGVIKAGSRNRWITPESDNFGFAAWVEDNKENLLNLGPGYHYGEWWGKGIQRGYDLDHRRFSLFNVTRWAMGAPSCCHVVPVLGYYSRLSNDFLDEVMSGLKAGGSVAKVGFEKPEGIVVYHQQSGHMYKKTFEHDATGKGQ